MAIYSVAAAADVVAAADVKHSCSNYRGKRRQHVPCYECTQVGCEGVYYYVEVHCRRSWVWRWILFLDVCWV